MSAVNQDKLESARLYRLLHRGSEGDASFYIDACRGAGSVLELGCGFGRLLAPLAQDGMQVTGVDRDEAMLKLAAETVADLSPEDAGRVALLEGDMTRFDAGKKFDRVLIPFNGLYCLSSDEAVLSCFKTAKAHLAENGRLLFDVYTVDPEDEPNPGEEDEDAVEYLTTILDGDREIDVRERDVWDPQASTVEVTYLFTFREGGAARQVRQTIVHRYMTPETTLQLLDQAGFRVMAKYGGFTREEPDRDSVHLIVEAG